MGRVNRNLNTSADAGRFLAGLALGTIAPLHLRTYIALCGGHLTWPDPSLLARSDDLADAVGGQGSPRGADQPSWAMCAGAGAVDKGVPP